MSQCVLLSILLVFLAHERRREVGFSLSCTEMSIGGVFVCVSVSCVRM